MLIVLSIFKYIKIMFKQIIKEISKNSIFSIKISIMTYPYCKIFIYFTRLKFKSSQYN